MSERVTAGRSWVGYIISALPVLFLLMDAVGKFVKPELRRYGNDGARLRREHNPAARHYTACLDYLVRRSENGDSWCDPAHRLSRRSRRNTRPNRLGSISGRPSDSHRHIALDGTLSS